jgi:HSP20 family molecular chaperone IbpA
MNDSQQVAKRPSDATRQQPQAQAREAEYTLVPPADIFEDADGISVVLDMPGVSKDRLHVKAEANGLVVEGDAEISMPEGMEAVYADIRATHYRRSFGLTGELDADHIEAALKDGVLTLRIPKRAESKPRRIEIKSD